MTRSTLRIGDLHAAVLLVGFALAGYRAFWHSRLFHLGWFLAILTVATLGARAAAPRWRAACLGYSLFGWAYLVSGLRGGFGLDSILEYDLYMERLHIGLYFGSLCAFIAFWIFRSPASPEPGLPPAPGQGEGTYLASRSPSGSG